MEEKDAYAILERIQRGTSTEEELSLFDQWYFQYHPQYIREYSEAELKSIQKEMRRKLPVKQSILGNQISGGSRLSRWQLMAASVLLISGFAFYFFKTKPVEIIPTTKYSNDVSPGGNKAFLTLANGQRISLSDAKNGELAQETGVKITKLANGEVSYEITGQVRESANTNLLYNTIETPKGGQYHVILPDGTKVWLNAASTLKFPSSFARLVNRRVELLGGEAYFEVAKDPKHPFILRTAQQEVQVLGTHFNINAYPDESSVKTTLLEGRLLINKHTILNPGEESTLADHKIKVVKIDSRLAVAWKNNEFVFDSDDIKYIMRMVSRWYNVEIIYDGDIPKDKFIGVVSRFEDISEVLKSLELTKKVHFKVEGRRVIVSK